MKYSGIEWIGEIPENWSIVRFKDLYRNKKEIVGDKVAEYERLALTLNGVILRNKEDSEGLQPEKFDGYQILHKDDFIFKMIDLQNISTSRVGLSPFDGLVSPAYIRFCPKNENQYSKFVYYFLMSMYYNCVFNSLGGNGVRSALNAVDMGQLLIPYPNVEEQQVIVNKIEIKCAEIDKLIANQQAQIDKLKEYKQSVITEAVTKGLDPTVPMKDSGVEWIGQIPQSWEVVRLKFLLNSPMQYGANESGQLYDEKCVRYIRITDITQNGTLKNDDVLYLPLEKAVDYILKDKDVLFARSGATVGKTFLFKSRFGKSAFAGYLIKADCDKEKLVPEYLMYFTQSKIYNLWKQMIFIQSTIQNIGASKYENMQVVVPNIETQQQIADYLDDKCGKIDQLIAIKQQKIDKLQQYKKSLIYEYVTGKKEV